MSLADYLNLKERKYVVAGRGRTESYERAGAAGVALERQTFVRRAYGIVERCADGPYGADVDAALGFSAHSTNVWALLEDVAPPQWAGVLAALEQIERWQAGYDAQGEAREAVR